MPPRLLSGLSEDEQRELLAARAPVNSSQAGGHPIGALRPE